MATAPPIVAPQIPNAVPRSRPVNAPAMRASEVANIAAPPAPWSARARLSTHGVPDSAHSSDATVNTTIPPANTLRRPIRSASEPADSSRAASPSE